MREHAETAQRLARLRHLVRTGQAQTIREAADLSQAEVARLVGVAPSTMCRWEAGLRKPQGEAALRYLDVLMGMVAA